MASVVISDELRDQLRAADGPVEFVDESGAVVGRFVALVQLCGQWVAGDFPTDEEIDRELRAGRFKTAEQATAWLEDLKAREAAA